MSATILVGYAIDLVPVAATSEGIPMGRIVPPGFRRDHLAKTSVRTIEARLIQDLADEKGCCPGDIVYLAVVKLLRERFPDQCEVEEVGASLLVR